LNTVLKWIVLTLKCTVRLNSNAEVGLNVQKCIISIVNKVWLDFFMVIRF